MEMFRKHSSSLLVIIAGLLFCTATAYTQNPQVYQLCQLSTPAVLSVTPTSQPFLIQSPYYGYANYDNNLDCSLTITSGLEPMVLSFEYRVFNLEDVKDCIYDYLCVVGVKFCGSWATGRMFQKMLPPRSNSTVYFHTDYSVTLSGFHIIVTAQPVLKIHEVVGSGRASEEITYVPVTYTPGMQYTDGCSGISPPIIYHFCNIDQSNNYIDINNGTAPFRILSPNYGGVHNYVKCPLVIRSGAEPLVLYLRILDFQVKYSESCLYDYLCVHGTKFCGEWLTENTLQYILPENSTFTMVFRTDFVVNQNGFEIEVFQEIATANQIILQPRGNVASSMDNITFTLETYAPGFPYSDRCLEISQ